MTHLTTAGQIPIGASTGFNLYAYTPVRGMRKDEIAQVARDFGKAVHTAHDAGFDSVEVHAGHGYLISQFLSPYTNHRKDEYGGTLENRMRFMRMCLTEVMEAAAKTGTAVLVKHNMYDGFKGGIEIPESIAIAREMKKPLFLVVTALTAGGVITHTCVPPTSGPLACAGIMGVDTGLMILVGVVVGAIAMFVTLKIMFLFFPGKVRRDQFSLESCTG